MAASKENFVPGIGMDVYRGASFLSKLYVENQIGNELYRTKHDVTSLWGATFSGRF